MSRVLSNTDWQPTASLQALKARAELYHGVRQFFAARDVLEVETPLMCTHAVTDPYIQAFEVHSKFLQTSPEYAMKRLLAAGSGSIYQICKAFRQEESGSLHNPEFTMLEWYRVGFDDKQLMQETDQLLQDLLGVEPAMKISYLDLFVKKLDINPHTADLLTLRSCAARHNINLSSSAADSLSITDWLQLLMSYVIEPQLTGDHAWIIYDFPVAQAALARIKQEQFPVAARFEVYMHGIELANGYYELQDPGEQQKRFLLDNEKRSQNGTRVMQADRWLIAALEHGLPECAGIAMGLDRLLMLKMAAKSLAEVMPFTSQNA